MGERSLSHQRERQACRAQAETEPFSAAGGNLALAAIRVIVWALGREEARSVGSQPRIPMRPACDRFRGDLPKLRPRPSADPIPADDPAAGAIRRLRPCGLPKVKGAFSNA